MAGRLRAKARPRRSARGREDGASRQRGPTTTVPDVLHHLLEENGLRGADLSRLLGGSRNLGAMILRGERQLTVGHIRKLAARFRVSPAVFLR